MGLQRLFARCDLAIQVNVSISRNSRIRSASHDVKTHALAAARNAQPCCKPLLPACQCTAAQAREFPARAERSGAGVWRRMTSHSRPDKQEAPRPQLSVQPWRTILVGSGTKAAIPRAAPAAALHPIHAYHLSRTYGEQTNLSSTKKRRASRPICIAKQRC